MYFKKFKFYLLTNLIIVLKKIIILKKKIIKNNLNINYKFYCCYYELLELSAIKVIRLTINSGIIICT